MFDALTIVSQWSVILLQLVLAALLGGVIGYQRETVDRPAGFRTHVLVCVGSAVYMLVSIAAAGDRFDPGRIAAQVASGMGFLGAGTIIKQGSIVRGLTTAASLWAVAGIGLAVGLGGVATGIALLGTVVVFTSLGFLGSIERRFWHDIPCILEISLTDTRARLAWLRSTLGAHGLVIRSLDIQHGDEEVGQVTIYARTPTREALESAGSILAQGEGVEHVHWTCR